MKTYELPCICEDALSKPFPLSGARVARIRGGPGITAMGIVLMPCEKKRVKGYETRIEIRPMLQLGERFVLAGERLTSSWGFSLAWLDHELPSVAGTLKTFGLSDAYRLRWQGFPAPTWAEAMRQAWDWAIGEVLRLEEALRKAECEACTPHEDPYVERPEEEAVRRLESMKGP
jgi:hypothetical protein